MGVDAARLGAEVEVGLEEGAVGLVDLPRLDDGSGKGMLVAIKEALGEARQTVGGLAVRDAKAVKSRGDRLRRPDIHLPSGLRLEHREEFLLSALQFCNKLLTFFSIEIDAPIG